MPSAPSTLSEHAHAVASTLRIGERGYVGPIVIRRTSLLTYAVAGFALDLDELGAEVAYLVEEREGVLCEPSFRRATEIASIRHPGRYTVRLDRIVSGDRYFEARWNNARASQREERAALIALAGSACELGIDAHREGCLVVARVPAPAPQRPGLASTHRRKHAA